MSNRRIFKNFLSFSVGNWVNIIIGIIAIPLVTRILSPEEYGRVSMFILAVNIGLIIVNLGIDQSFVRFYYEEDKNNKSKLLLQCLKLPVIVFIIISFVIFLFQRNISYLLFDIYDKEAIYLLILSIFFSFINGFSLLVLRMEQMGIKYSLLQIFNKLFDISFFLLFYFLIGAEYKIMLLSYTGSIFFVTLLSIYYGRSLWLNIFKKTDIKLINSIKDVVKYGYPLMFSIALVWVFQSIDRFSIKQWSSMEELGLYSAAYKVIALLTILKTSFSNYWTPLSLEKYQENTDNRSFFEKMFLLIFIGMMILSTIFVAI